MKAAVVFFSATGNTESAAKLIAAQCGGELFPISPAVPYEKADLNWLNPLSRTTKEMHNKKSRPEILEDSADFSGYDVVFLGFPIWWYIAPTIVNSYLESHDFAGKRIILFATSGGSGFGKAVKHLQPSCPGALIEEGQVFKEGFDARIVADWVKEII